MSRPKLWRRLWPRVIIVGFFVGALVPPALYSYSRISPYLRAWLAAPQGSTESILVPSTLCRFGVVHTIGMLPPSAVILALRPADMYYAGRRMISYLDPRLVPFYEARTPEAGLEILKNLGIQYVQSTSYAMPVLYNSVLSKILSDSRYSHIVYSSGREALYELESNAEEPRDVESHSIGPRIRPWVENARFLLMGGYSIELGKKNIDDAFTPSSPIAPIFIRDQEFIQQMDAPILIDPEQEQILTMTLSGKGFAHIIVSEISNQSKLREHPQKRASVSLFDIHLNGEPRTITTRFMPLQDIHSIEVGMSQRAGSRIKVEAASLRSVDVEPRLKNSILNMTHRCWE